MKPVVQNIFRAYDIRGVVDSDFDPEWVETLGRACGAYFLERGFAAAVVGHDCRHSSPGYQNSLAAGLAATGVDVTRIGHVPTPALYFAVKHLRRSAGVMITASHNPSAYNGFKIWAGPTTIHTEEIQRIYRIMAAGAFPTGNGVVCDLDIAPSYLDELAARLKPVPAGRTVRVVLDGGNGSGGALCEALLRRMGAEVIPLYCDADGSFPNHHPDPLIEANMADLKAAVVREGADCGLALDGDADRVGVVDEKGAMVWGDQVLALFARDMLRDHPGATVIGDVKCTHRLFADIAAHGGAPLMGVTGHSVMKARMIETGAKLAGELSGHMFFADRFFGFDDALYAAARFVELVAHAPHTPVSAMLADWPQTYSTPELHIHCPDAIKFQVVAKAQAYFRERCDTSEVDGVRATFADGWGLIRASNTQPVLVLRFEAESEERLQAIRDLMETPLTQWIKQLQ
ncbi:MAG: phosphomannomutase/phosphoglucomutase [Desulfovibrionaceae bacterium]